MLKEHSLKTMTSSHTDLMIISMLIISPIFHILGILGELPRIDITHSLGKAEKILTTYILYCYLPQRIQKLIEHGPILKALSQVRDE